MLAEHKSRTLAEIIREVNKRSDNPIARQLYLVLGTLPQTGADTHPTPDISVSDPAPGLAGETAARADKVVRAWLAARGLDDEGLVLENGSGLSRHERIRPALLACVLAAASRSDWMPEFLASLPIVGVETAMSRRLRESPASNKGRFKTGTLRNTVSAAGYVPDASGQMCVVVVIINYETADGALAKNGRLVIDSLIDWVARSGIK